MEHGVYGTARTTRQRVHSASLRRRNQLNSHGKSKECASSSHQVRDFILFCNLRITQYTTGYMVVTVQIDNGAAATKPPPPETSFFGRTLQCMVTIVSLHFSVGPSLYHVVQESVGWTDDHLLAFSKFKMASKMTAIS